MIAGQQLDHAPPYAEYARVYDRTGQTHFSILMDLYLREIVRDHGVSGNRLLDVACGTGTLAIMMAEAGWDVTGLDLSPAMLDEARGKARAAGVEGEFVHGDMRSFSLPEPVHLATCCFDTLNYLLEDDELLACFRSVYDALEPGGIFCFDLATDYFLRNYWQGVETYEDAGYAQVMESSYDEATGHSTLRLSGTFRPRHGDPRHFHEVHVERAFNTLTVRGLLDLAGFVPEALYDCFTHQEPNDMSLRHFWVARRPG